MKKIFNLDLLLDCNHIVPINFVPEENLKYNLIHEKIINSNNNDFLKQIVLEANKEILNDLKDNAETVIDWDFSKAVGETIAEKYLDFIRSIEKLSNIIKEKSEKNKANFITAHNHIMCLFTHVSGYNNDDILTRCSVQFPLEDGGIKTLGILNNNYMLYENSFFNKNVLLSGYSRRDNIYNLDSGYIYNISRNIEVYNDKICIKYNKYFIDKGKSFYSRMNINNFLM